MRESCYTNAVSIMRKVGRVGWNAHPTACDEFEEHDPMKITDINTHVIRMNEGLAWVFVSVDTDEGIRGWGECTDYIANTQLVRGIEAVKPFVVGSDASHIEEIWQRIFHIYSDLNGRGFVSHLISGIDIALWDIKGKALGKPIYDLLGGPVRESVPVYTHVSDTSQGDTFEEHLEGMMEDARQTKAAGYQAIKTDPFPSRREYGRFRGASMVERIDPAGMAQAVRWMEGLREAVGDEYELMVDAHARFDVASAIEACRNLEHIGLVWLEEPIHVENHNALKHVRENVNVPLCIGERHFTRWDYWQIINDRLVDYIMPDVAWCGGISELRRIAAMAEVGYIRVSPHDALGPIAIAASFQLCMTIPNLYREECVHHWFPAFEQLIEPMFDVRDGNIHPNGRPGLGIDFNEEVMERYRVGVDSPEARARHWFPAFEGESDE